MTKQQSALTTLLLTWLAALCTACTADSLTTAEDLPPTTQTGVLCLRLSSDPVFVHVETRSGTTLLTDFTGYDFTLSDGTPVTFDQNGAAIIPAGTYTLAATNEDSADPYAEPVYSGTSESFTLTAGGTAEVSIDLTPQNSKVTFTMSDAFKAIYQNASIKLSDNAEEQTLTTEADEAFFPIPADATNGTGTISYTITAKAIGGSHVQEFPTGTTGTITIEPGKQHTIHLDANPLNKDQYDVIISCKDSDEPHTGVFQ